MARPRVPSLGSWITLDSPLPQGVLLEVDDASVLVELKMMEFQAEGIPWIIFHGRV